MSFPDWITPAPLPHPDVEARGIFCLLIGQESYVGKSERFARSFREYEKNVRRLETGDAYRPGNDDGFRAVHRAMHAAKADKRPIVWLVLEVCDEGTDLNHRRAYWIRNIQPSLNGIERDAARRAHV